MYFPSSIFLLASTLIGSVFGGPLNRRVTPDPQKWDVSHFDYHCNQFGKCTYSFNIVGHATKKVPGFETYCKGHLAQKKPNITSCDDINISSSLWANAAAPGRHPFHLVVDHAWDSNGNIVEGKYHFMTNILKTPKFTMHPKVTLSCESPCN